jgi:hypothetical protein
MDIGCWSSGLSSETWGARGNEFTTKSAKGECMEFDDLSNRVIGCARLKDGIKRFVL